MAAGQHRQTTILQRRIHDRHPNGQHKVGISVGPTHADILMEMGRRPAGCTVR